MKLTTLVARRTIAAAAITSAAILLPAVALASSSGSSAPNTTALTRCYRSDLTAWVGVPGGQAAGSSYYQLEISNISRRTCTLYGFPGVSALLNGVQAGSAADRDFSHTPTLLTLAPGSTVHVILQITDVTNFPLGACKPVPVNALRIYAPGDYTSIEIPFSSKGCLRPGPIFLHVSTTIAGTGIPGYST